MTKQEFISWATARGFRQDKFGHMIKEDSQGGALRYKIQAISVCAERRARIVDHNEWLLRWSAYLKDISLTQDGKLRREGGLK